LPTAAFEVEGIHEILREGEWGFVVPQYDSQALADRIAQLLDAPDLGHRFGERARRHAEQRWDYPVMVDQLRRLYEQGPAAALAPAAVQEPARIRSQA
jgi:glycosyltransferase involved in cell wall biosynthesis